MEFKDLYDSSRFPKQQKNALEDPITQISHEEWNALILALRNIVEGGSTQYALSFEVQTPAIINTSESNPQLTFIPRFTAQKGASSPEQQSALISYRVVTIVNNAEVELQAGIASTGQSVSVAIGNYLSQGKSTTFTIYGTESNTSSTGSTTHTIMYTSLSLDCTDYDWATPWISDQTYQMGIFRCQGAASKVLHVLVNVGGYRKEYQKNIGTSTGGFQLSADVDGLSFPTISGTSATGTIEAWLSSGTVETAHQIFPLMLIKGTYAASAVALAVYHTAEILSNGEENDVFQYAVYNKGTETASVTFAIDNTVDTQTVQCGTALTYRTAINIDTDESEYEVTCRIASGGKYEQYQIPLDNSQSYPATSGAGFYMNPATRSNGQSNYLQIVNQINQQLVPATWQRMAWYDTADGWTYDDTGSRRCLWIPARSRCSIAYQPLQNGVENGMTIECWYKVKNVADYSEAIISVCSDRDSSDFVGIKITPDTISLKSTLLNSNDLVQSYNLNDEEDVHICITFVPNYFRGASRSCAAIVYVNGDKKVTIPYATSDSWRTTSDIVLGADNADLYCYGFRVYPAALGWYAVLQNCTNALPDNKAAHYNKWQSILDGGEISYDKVKSNYNCFTIELTSGSASSYHPELYQLPTFGHVKSYSANGTVEMSFSNGRTLTISNARIAGQGTTSMNYWLWNLRFRTDQNSNTTVTYSDAAASTGTCDFFGDGTNMVRITAKKNYASSSQSHKMGLCNAYHDLHEAIDGVKLTENEGARIAVHQVPAYGFLKVPLEDGSGYAYISLGMFTIGADKGDKPTFKWNGAYKNTMISLEGTDHDPRLTNFAYPWNDRVKAMYVPANESAYVTIDLGTSYQNGWEIGNARGVVTDGTKSGYSQSALQSVFNSYWKPAYLVAYDYSTRIAHLPTGYTIASINASDASVANFQKVTDAEGNPMSYYEIFDDNYDLYYYDPATRRYVKSRNLKAQMSVSTVSGATWDNRTETIKVWRRSEFKKKMQQYWHLDDTLFHFCLNLIEGVSDNLAKNTYPYNLNPEIYKFRWRSDDNDTIWNNDNPGLDTKNYDIEYKDFTDAAKSAYVFKGSQSVFWTLIAECYPDEIRAMGYNILDKMCQLAKTSGTGLDKYGKDSSIGKLMQFHYDYFWDATADTFPHSAYNIDAETAYESAYPMYGNGYNPDVSPAEQSRGSHCESEQRWVYRRMIYCMSLFRYGSFNEGTGTSDTGLGQFEFRVQTAQQIQVTPATAMYPAFLIGQSSISRSSIPAPKNGVTTVPLASSADNTNTYIAAADWISDLGDLSGIAVDSGTSWNIGGKRMLKFKFGDAVASNVTSKLSAIGMGDNACPCLLHFDARNLASLTDPVNLSGCRRLIDAQFSGTNTTEVSLPDGSKIETLSLPSSISALRLVGVKYLTNFTHGSLANVVSLTLHNSPSVDMMDLLRSAYSASGSKLYQVSILGLDASASQSDITMMLNLGESADYSANIEGVVRLNGTIIERDKMDRLAAAFPGLIVEGAGGYYISFVDAEVLRVLLTICGDGTGITEEQAAAVTTMKKTGVDNASIFTANTTIETFDELVHFTGMTRLSDSLFRDCTSLKRVSLPLINGETYHIFQGCTSLTDVSFTAGSKGNWYEMFYGCTSLKSVQIPRAQLMIPHGFFYGCTSLDMDIPSWITEVKDYAFHGCTSFKHEGYFTNNGGISCYESCEQMPSVRFKAGVNSIGYRAFYNCKKMRLSSLPDTIVKIGHEAFEQCLQLTATALPSGLIDVGNGAFLHCENFAPVVMPSTVTNIGMNAFGYTKAKFDSLPANITLGQSAFVCCAEMPLSQLPEGTTTVPYGCFVQCVEMTASTFPDAMTTLERDAFRHCLKVSFSEWNNITYAGPYCFQSCSEVHFSTIPSWMTEIPEGIFWGTKCTFSALPAGCTKIGMDAFFSVKTITRIGPIPNTVTEIGAGAFDYCENLVWTDGDFPDSITEIPERCFEGNDCSDVHTLPSALTKIGGAAFGNCNFGQLTFPNTITELGGFYGNNNLTFDAYPTSLKTISKNCFVNCSSITCKVLPNGLETIEEYAFAQCYGMTGEIILPSSIREIAPRAFQHCGGLTSVKIPSTNITAIEAQTFYGCIALTNVELSNTITSIGDQAFYSTATITLKLNSTTPPTMGTQVMKAGSTVCVPAASLDVYLASPWAEYTITTF